MGVPSFEELAVRDEVETVGQRVRSFYEQCSFPGYEDDDDVFQLTEKARRGVYAKMLDDQLPYGVRILDAGCGTGQLPIFLSINNRRAVGIDFSMGSLRKGHAFTTRFELKNVAFVQMDLFALGCREESFDYVFSNGVLHHTADAYQAFRSLCPLVKKGGYLVIGLYNRYGRLLLDLRRLLFNISRERLVWLDHFVRKRGLHEEKTRIWYMDQYRNPHEEKFAVSDVLRWFTANGIEYVNSIPKIRLGERLTPDDVLFEVHAPGTAFEHVLRQLGWIFTMGREGGFFIMIGRRVR